MAESHDVSALKRRGRRRLVGAIALVLLAVIVLPWIFDPQPRQTPPVSVRIPSQDESSFKPKPKPVSKPPPPPVEAVKPAPAPDAVPAKPDAPKPEAKPAEKAPAAKAAPAPVAAERARAEAALANVQYIVPVGAYADPAGVIAKLKSAKLAYFTEPVATAKGTVTRVRAGPFASREAAEKAHKQLKALGFAPGNIASRS
jgi:DedD protein